MEVVNKPCRTTLRNGGSCFRSYLNRFISADTIIPQPTDPQSYNRYSYARNNPVNRTDPTGHIDVNCLEDCTPVATPQAGTPPTPLVLFDGIAGQEWTAAEMRAVREGALAVAEALANAINADRQAQAMARRIGEPFEPFAYTPISARDAFLSVYGSSVTFYKTGTASAAGNWGKHEGPVAGIGDRVIYVYTQASDGVRGDITTTRDGTNYGELWAVHELGHAFNGARVNATNGSIDPYGNLDDALGVDGALSAYSTNPRAGMNAFPWQQNTTTNDTNEVFADYFLNWTYNSFGSNDAGRDQYSWMNSQMPYWLP